MSLAEEFAGGVPAFMGKYTLYFPGVVADGGAIDFRDPSYQAYSGNPNVIQVPATVVEAAWRPGVRPNHVRLALKVARVYKMGPTGRTEIPAGAGRDAAPVPLLGTHEQDKKLLIRKAKANGATDATAKAYARQALDRTERRVAGDEWFGCYFLPYSQGRTTRMTLGTGADYFFTATMNGCAFHVTGNPHAPSVAHLNTTRPQDTLPDAVVTKADIKQRYAAAVGTGSAHDGLLTKYKGPGGFQGNAERYKLTAGELAAVTDPDLAPGAKSAADLNTFVVGVRDATHGWEFFYQRNAVLLTNVQTVTLMAGDYHAKNLLQWAKKKLGRDHEFKFKVNREVKTEATPINHVVTACRRLQFP
jgi:hypothetical protein